MAKSCDAPGRNVLVIESSSSTDTTPISSFLTSLGFGSHGVDLERFSIDGEFKGGTLATRTKVFQRIDEMKKVVVLQKQPDVVDFYDPFFAPALGIFAAAVLVLFSLRFTPW